MQNTMSNTLSVLRKQVEAGLSHKSDNTTSLKNIDRPVQIGDLLARAETAREELRHTGYRNN